MGTRNKTDYHGSFEHEIGEEADLSATVQVQYDISPYTPEKLTLANGDPGYPAEGGEVEDFTVTLRGLDITSKLTPDECAAIRESCYRDHENKA